MNFWHLFFWLTLVTLIDRSETFRLRRFKDVRHLKRSMDDQEIDRYIFTQKVDHFSENDTRTFRQYYRHFNASEPSEIHFLKLGGEGGDDVCLLEGIANEWAEELHADIWCLQHRFYGNSQPFESLSVKNLQYLSSKQALADAAEFIIYQNKVLNLTNPKWVVFGGSYPGMLALWMRQQYPDLVIGAVGSSAPVEATLDFYNYLQVCHDSITFYSPQCASDIEEAFRETQKMLYTEEGRSAINEIFNLTSPLDDNNIRPEDVQEFFGSLIHVIAGNVQDGGLEGAIPLLCEAMTVPYTNPVVKLANYYFKNNEDDLDYLDNDYSTYVQVLRDESINNKSAMYRAWIWQTCTEFGFFQSTDVGRTIFGSVLPVKYGFFS